MTEVVMQKLLKDIATDIRAAIATPDKYSHYVYSAADTPENEVSNKNALDTVDFLESIWEMNAYSTGHYDGCNFYSHVDAGNLIIRAEASDLLTLVEGCMVFAREKGIRDYKSTQKCAG